MDAGIYLHIPFCQVRCSYCDFNTYTGLENAIPAYIDGLGREIGQVGRSAVQAGHGRIGVPSIFFGGGTPSLLPTKLVRAVLDSIHAACDVETEAEVTLEANPGTVDEPGLADLREMGVNRLSYGVQSAQEHELRLLDRLHTFEQAVQAVAWARRAGFDNLNLDLIYGIMGQTLAAWRDTLRRALDLAPEHLSLYALTLETGTPMQARVAAGTLPTPDPDLAADMYEWAREELGTLGYRHYEISNWALDGEPGNRGAPFRACRHNLLTWRLMPYLGLGAGAHGSVPGLRYANVRHPSAYLERLQSGAVRPFPLSNAVGETWPIDGDAERKEFLMLGLRLVEEGVEEAVYQARFGSSLRDDFGPRLSRLVNQGLVEWSSGRIRLTPRAHLIANQVFVHFA